jgi:hypothetical protein
MSDEPRATGPIQILSEARGPHWVAWAARDDRKPLQSVLLVARTRDEAEARARNWVKQFDPSGRG